MGAATDGPVGHQADGMATFRRGFRPKDQAALDRDAAIRKDVMMGASRATVAVKYGLQLATIYRLTEGIVADRRKARHDATPKVKGRPGGTDPSFQRDADADVDLERRAAAYAASCPGARSHARRMAVDHTAGYLNELRSHRHACAAWQRDRGTGDGR